MTYWFWHLKETNIPVNDVLVAENLHLVLEIPVDRNVWR